MLVLCVGRFWSHMDQSLVFVNEKIREQETERE